MLAACATRPVLEGNEIADDAVWALRGRIGISSDGQNGTFSVDWRQDGATFEISLSGPLGIGVARITGAPRKTVLEVPGETPVIAESADGLLQATIGLNIPVEPLRFWVRGLPAPGPFERTDDGLRQEGWTVTYLAKEEGGLPTRLRLSRPEARVTMVIKQWID
jgi:outer membrane lipoprotein LolB